MVRFRPTNAFFVVVANAGTDMYLTSLMVSNFFRGGGGEGRLSYMDNAGDPHEQNAGQFPSYGDCFLFNRFQHFSSISKDLKLFTFVSTFLSVIRFHCFRYR